MFKRLIKSIFKIKIFTIFMLISVTSYGLEIDEKLTFRILNLSSSGKTALINRGLEDGLEVGNHAKFFLSYGVIARAELVKASPARSVWAIYRVINSKDLIVNKVMKLKIASPVKLTEDPSKMLVNEDSRNNSQFESQRLKVDQMPEQNDREMLAGIEGDLSPSERIRRQKKSWMESEIDQNKSFRELEEAPVSFSQRKWEVHGSYSFNSYTVTSSSETEGELDEDNSVTQFGLGLERYFFNRADFWSKFSLGFILQRSSMSGSYQLRQASGSALNYGLFTSYHFGEKINQVASFIPYINAGFGLGSSSIDQERSENLAPQELDGDLNYFNLGVGVKYYTSYGLGFRGLLDYYRQGQNFETENDTLTRLESGLRLRLSVGYRF